LCVQQTKPHPSSSHQTKLNKTQIASNTTWSELRALVTGYLAPGAAGDAADLMALLEGGRATAGVVPFGNMTDRPYWLPGASVADLKWQELYMGGARPTRVPLLAFCPPALKPMRASKPGMCAPR
jgi:hypothetical protein